jgi:microcystin-dependent protein
MSCQNCFNGCVEITSDKCVRYTGEDFPILGISNGDTLLSVEEKILNFLLSISTGGTIFPVISQENVCNLIQTNLPAVGPYSLDDYLNTLIKVACQLDSRLTILETQNPNTPYELNCLFAATTDNSDTHAVLQLVIDKLCVTSASLTTFKALVDATYVKITDVDTYIANYLATDPSQNLISNSIVPYAITAYGGPLSNFDASGAGIGTWNRIFLCNGLNGTLDLRGRVLVGTTSGMGGSGMSSAVNPAVAGNPTYNLNQTQGSNTVILNQSELPSHTHTVGNVSQAPDHVHGFQDPVSVANAGLGSVQRFTTNSDVNSIDITQTEPAGSHTHTVNINSTGGGQGHLNYQPGIGVYYIIYIP